MTVKKESRILNKQNWHAITSDTLWNVYSLLYATRTLVDTCIEREEGEPTVAAGLYTFAVEEYGKYLYLKSLEPIDEKYHIDYDYFQKHSKKFEQALSNLPHESTRPFLSGKNNYPSATLFPESCAIICDYGK